MLALLRFNSGSDAIVLWPPSRTVDKQWHVVDSNLMVHESQENFEKVLAQRNKERRK